MVRLYSYPAGAGDFFWLRFGEAKNYNFVIDGGESKCKLKFKKMLSDIKEKGEQVDALLLTHFDNDHIMGMLKGLQIAQDEGGLPRIARIYLNTGRGIAKENGMGLDEHFPEDDITITERTNLCAAKEAVKLLDFIQDLEPQGKILCNYISMETEAIEFEGCACRIISPNTKALRDILDQKWSYAPDYIPPVKCAGTTSVQKDLSELMDSDLPEEDGSVSNRASIAFLFQYANVKIAFLGDAAPSVCLEGLKRNGFDPDHPCNVDLVKLSHHGSARNYRDDLYQTLRTSNYLLSTDGRSGRLPDKIVLAKLLRVAEDKPITLYCNRNLWEQPQYFDYFTEADQKEVGDRLARVSLDNSPDGIRIKDGFELHGAR